MHKKKKRFIFRTIVLLILVISLVVVLFVNAQKDNPLIAEGDQAPDFMLERLDNGETIQLHDLKGKGVMINFWATYCEPCKKEMPFMDELYKKYKDDGFEIIAVSVDKNELVIRNFFERLGLSFPIVHDKKGVVMEAYNIVPLPTSYFINPDGTIDNVVKGPLTLKNLETYIQNILPK
ncbi:thiol-disulfide oxidoreductase ResA [Bacillaceae bacterium W0354]